MQTKPAGWPASGPVEVVPEAFLVLPGSSWPPAAGTAPAGTAVLASWAVDRELTGSNLPGQVRGSSGFSVATGSVSFPQPAVPLVPWGQGAQAIGPGGKARLVMSYAGPTGAGLQLGSFVVQPITGANNEPAVSLDLAEDSLSLRKPVSIPATLTLSSEWTGDSKTPIEAAWVLDQTARAAGFRVVPDPVPSCIWAFSGTGSPYLSVGSSIKGPTSWAEYAGRIVWTPKQADQTVNGVATQDIPDTVYVTAERAGAAALGVKLRGVLFSIYPDHVVADTATGTASSLTYPSAAAGTMGKVQVQADFAGKQFRVRTGQSAAWTAWTNITGTIDSAAQPGWAWLFTYAGDDLYAGSVQIHTADDPGVWEAPTAKIAPTGSMLDAVIVPDAKDGWALIQEIAQATQGAAWVDEAGVLNYRGYEALRGVGATAETIEAMDSIESLQWRVDPADTADRVTVTYTPADIQRVTDQSLFVWEATDPVQIGAGKTVTLNVDLDGVAADSLAGWLPVWDTTTGTRFSRWAAASARSGSGTQPPSTALQITAELVTPSKVRISLTNTTSGTLWTVDGNGNTVLILRANVVAKMGEPRTIATGAPAEKALVPLDIDLGAWVQDDDAAQRYLAWLTGQTSKAQATIERVRVKPDLGRQLGDVIRLTDSITGLSTKALVTGVHLSGEAGAYTQHLDLALLDFVWADLDTALAGLGLTTFQQLDDYLAANSITTFADFDNWLISLGGTN